MAVSREQAARADRRRRIERELAQADAIDIETAAIMVEAELGAGTDPKAAVVAVKKRKPFLFRSVPRPTTMSARVSAASPVDAAAAQARASGDRGSLMQYLRAKRGG